MSNAAEIIEAMVAIRVRHALRQQERDIKRSLRRYHAHLKDHGKVGQALAVDYCGTLVRRACQPPPPD